MNPSHPQDSSTDAVTPAASPAAALHSLLGNDGLARRWWRRPVLWLGLLAAALVLGGVYYWRASQQASAAPLYVTEEVRRGNIVLTVAANGTLQPTRAVTIGSELSGTVRGVYVDINDKVRKGQLLLDLDTAKLKAQEQRSRAAVAAAQARLAQAEVTVQESRANLARLEEVARLSAGKVPSAAELDTGRATLARAQADEASARAGVDDAKAALANDETNLSKASIRSPIDGVVLSRSVEPGNSVAASLQAVTLLTLAEDLTRLRLDVNVDEADVGAVQVGQKASFTVSAHPARKYPAQTTRVAFGSTKTDNVVTYIAWLDVDNSDLSLRPGMTASATITSTERNQVLLVPNTALRFTPAPEAGAQTAEGVAAGASPGGGAAGSTAGSGAAGSAGASKGGIMSQLMPRMPRTARRAGDGGKGAEGSQRQIWLLKNGVAVPQQVTVGISDGRMTEVSGEGLEPGMAVITDQRSRAAAP